jgi:peptide/nickel transport system substrate-binding protein
MAVLLGLRRSTVLKVCALVAFGLLLVAACGGKSGSSSNGKPDESALTSGYGLDIRPAPPSNDPHNPDAGAGTPKRGGKVVFALQAEDDNGYCIPGAQLDTSGIQVAASIFDTLTIATVDGKFVPYLAEKVDHSDDYKTWTITLRPGIKFSDGSPLDAQVVKNNLDAWRGKYKGQSAVLRSIIFGDIADTKVTGPLTVEVDMSKPWRDFDTFLATPGSSGMIGQSQLDDPQHCATKLVGTGPFVLESWTVGQRYVLKPNPNYWRKGADGKPLPYLSELDYVPILDSNAELSAFTAGTAQVMITSRANNVLKLRDLAKNDKATVITSVRSAGLDYFLLNSSTAPFNDESMRIAATEAINMDQINRDIHHGLTPLASQPFPHDSPVINPAITRRPLNMPDAQKRVQAYTAAHGGTKPKVVVSTTTEPVNINWSQVTVSYLKQAGFDASMTTMDQAQLIEASIKGEYQMMTFRQFSGADPGANYIWWYTGYPTNFARMSDPIIDCLLDVGRQGQAAAACLKDQKLNADYDTGLPAGLPKLSDISPDDIPAIFQAVSEEFKKKAWAILGQYIPWTIATAPNVHGIFGPDNPDGSKPSQSLVQGTPVASLWVG